MLYNLHSPIDREKFGRKVLRVLEDKSVIELKVKTNRTRSQNNYLHLILTWFAMESGYTLAESKQIYKSLNGDIFFYIRPPEPMTFMRSTTDLDTAEMTETIEKFRNYSAKEADIYLPAPNERDYLQEIEVRASSQRSYL